MMWLAIWLLCHSVDVSGSPGTYCLLLTTYYLLPTAYYLLLRKPRQIEQLVAHLDSTGSEGTLKMELKLRLPAWQRRYLQPEADSKVP